MEELHMTSAGMLSEDEVVIELTDGRTLAFSLEKILTLVPDDVTSDEGQD